MKFLSWYNQIEVHISRHWFSKETCKALGIKHILSSANHPQSQDQVERQNQLVDNIRCVIEEAPCSWPRAVAVVQFAHNTAVNATTGYTPHELLFGQASRRPETLLARQLSLSERLSDSDRENDETHKEMARRRVVNTIQKMDKIFRSVRRRIAQCHEKRKIRAIQ